MLVGSTCAKQHNIYAHTHLHLVLFVCCCFSVFFSLSNLIDIWKAFCFFSPLLMSTLHCSTNINLFHGCAHFFLSNYLSSFSPLLLYLSIVYNKYRLRCKGKTGPAVYICVCVVYVSYFCLFVLLSKFDIISCVCCVVVCLISSLYMSRVTNVLSFVYKLLHKELAREILWASRFSFSISFCLDCTIVIFVSFCLLSTRVQKLSKLIWVFLFVCFCVDLDLYA